MNLRGLTEKEILNLSMGFGDFVEVSSTSVTPPAGQIFHAIICDTDATYSATTKSGSNLSSRLRIAGSIRIGRFTGVTETSGGTVLCYYAPDVG